MVGAVDHAHDFFREFNVSAGAFESVANADILCFCEIGVYPDTAHFRLIWSSLREEHTRDIVLLDEVEFHFLFAARETYLAVESSAELSVFNLRKILYSGKVVVGKAFGRDIDVGEIRI